MGAALVMAMFAMVAAATYQGVGFFTPLYHIASVLTSGESMMTSMERSMAGDAFTFAAVPAIVGVAVHMMTGVGYGIAFVLLVRLLNLRGAALLALGAAYGVAVFAFSTWAGLPLAAAITGAGAPISDMATVVGYPTFLAEHVLFSIALAALLSRMPLRQK